MGKPFNTTKNRAKRIKSPAMIEIVELSAAQTFSLRAAVLRAGIPVEQVNFHDNNPPGSRHFGAFAEGELVGAGYISPNSEPNDIDSEGATPGGWQLRGMSVSENQRGRGIGRAIVLRCIEAAREENAPVLWCNARVRAVELYRREGFIGVGEVFEIQGIGPHLRMRLDLLKRD